MQRRAFARFAWFFVAYLVAVILFGAWVRITGSGNGCGSHWPACNGAIVPPAPEAKTVIEYTHRVMTAFALVFAVTLVAWARRIDRPVFRAAQLAVAFLILEALLGALLVKANLVVNDASVARAITVALHLANTLLLTASATLVAWRATFPELGAPGPEIGTPVPASRVWLGIALVLLLASSMSGAVTALGDTVFPAQPALDGSLLAHIRTDVSPGQHFLVRLRFLHPLVAVVAVVLVAWALLRALTARTHAGSPLSKLATLACTAVALQTGVGVVNVLLAAPGWIQVLHLLLAQAVWIATWLTFLAARRP